ncbi:MAG: hypothetical protein KGI25_04435, partial [Thaumarchaeota archaeon]|nr:hypothetical protein [Nitrososphaerota archaeon]
ERDALVEAIDSKVGDFLDSELSELREDIERFRDLEAEHAEKLVEAKGQMADELKSDLKELVEKIDSFLEIRIAAEMEELREDLEVVKQNEFGRRVFEAFSDEFTRFVDADTKEASVGELSKRLEETVSALEASEKKVAVMEREQKLKRVLAPLKDRPRDIMEAILKNVDTDQLDSAYKTFIGRVLRESDGATGSEKEGAVLAEGASRKSERARVAESAIAKYGDTEVVTEGETKPETKTVDPAKEAELARIRKIAGIK